MPKFLIKLSLKNKSPNIFQTQGFTSNNTREHKIKGCYKLDSSLY